MLHHVLIDELARRVLVFTKTLQVSFMAVGDGLIREGKAVDRPPTNVLGMEQVGFRDMEEGWKSLGTGFANAFSGYKDTAQDFLPKVAIQGVNDNARLGANLGLIMASFDDPSKEASRQVAMDNLLSGNLTQAVNTNLTEGSDVKRRSFS